MATKWKRVYVFISSTFNDMHAERDYLVKRVFPQLREWCERRKLRLIDIDLRWGVTEDDATRHRNVVKTCLSRIDQCRPFFLCFLGQRRGWVPSRSEIADETFHIFSELQSEVGKASITEMEILHAIIKPLHRNAGRDSDHPEHYEPAEHAYFYLRQPSYLADLPNEPAMLRETYTNDWIGNPAERAEADHELARWREQVIPDTQRPVRSYEARWSPSAKTPELALPLQCPASNEQNIERWRTQWRRIGVEVLGTDVEENPKEAGIAHLFNERITAGRLTDFTCNNAPLGDQILSDLQQGIIARYPDREEVAEASALQKELDQQEEFLSINCDGFIERKGAFAELDSYAENDSPSLFVLTSEGGIGKSTLLANWINRRRDHCGDTVVYRFVGQSDSSSSVPNLLRSILVELQDVHGLIPKTVTKSGSRAVEGDEPEEVPLEFPLDPVGIHNYWQANISDFGKQGKVIFVIDALDQLETGLQKLNWLPQVGLPKDVKFVVSVRIGADGSHEILDQWHQLPKVLIAEVKPFEDFDDRRALVRQYLDQYLKELDEKHVETLIFSEGANNPLFLKVVLSELRLFGAFSQLGDKIRTEFGSTPVSAFNAVLRRLESDPVYSAIDPSQSVPILFGLLSHARRGLQMDELVEQFATLIDNPPVADQVRDALNLTLRQVDAFLACRDNRYDFFYPSFKAAVIERYERGQNAEQPMTRTKEQWHEALANYFEKQSYFLEPSSGSGETVTTEATGKRRPNVRKVYELPWQRIHSANWDGVARALCDLRLVEAKCSAGMTYDLVHDYNAAMDSMPDFEHERAREATRRAMLQKYGRELANVGALPEPPDTQAAIDLMRCAEKQGASVLSSTAARISEFSQFVEFYSDTLNSYPEQTLTIAFNRINSGHVFESAKSLLSDRLEPWIGRDPRPLVTQLGPSVKRRLSRGFVESIGMSADARVVVTGGFGALSVWDGGTGELRYRFFDQTVRVPQLYEMPRTRPVAITADGRVVMSSWNDSGVAFWDCPTGETLRILVGHTDTVVAVAVSADAQLAISTSLDCTLRVWDVKNESLLREPERYSHPIRTIAMTPECRTAVSGSDDGTLRVWNPLTGEIRGVLEGQLGGPVESVAIACDGNTGIFVTRGLLGLWRIAETGLQASVLGRTEATAATVTPDGRIVLSGTADGTLSVWDSDARSCLRLLEGHSSAIKSVAISPDGCLAGSCSGNDGVFLWNLDGTSRIAPQPQFRKEHGRSDHYRLSVGRASDGWVAVTTRGEAAVGVWDVKSGQFSRSIAVSNFISRLAKCPDENNIVIASQSYFPSGTLIVLDMQSPHPARRVIRVPPPPITVLDISGDGKFAITAFHADTAVRVWNLQSGELAQDLTGHNAGVGAAAISFDGTLAVSGGQDLLLHVWDPKTGHLLERLEGHTGAITKVCLAADGSKAVSAGEDGTLRIWDIARAANLHTLRRDNDIHTDLSVMFGKGVAVSAGKYSMCAWCIHSGRLLATCPLDFPCRELESTDDGRIVASLDGGIQFFTLNNTGVLHHEDN